jgi:hypothetical protein
LGEVEKTIIQDIDRPFEHIFYLLASRIYDLGEVEKAMFKWVALAWDYISTFRPTQNTT